MSQSCYYQLLSSLPHINTLFDARAISLSRYQLEKRLSSLSPSDNQLLKKIEILIFFGEYTNNTIEGKKLIRVAIDTFAKIKSTLLASYIQNELDRKTLLMAIRQKNLQKPSPTNTAWSYGTRYEYIKRNWSKPTFGLEHAFLSTTKIVDLIKKDQALTVEKIILNDMWSALNALSSSCPIFSFDSVVAYIVRWNLVNRWVSYDKVKAVKRFEKIVLQKIDKFIENNV